MNVTPCQPPDADEVELSEFAEQELVLRIRGTRYDGQSIRVAAKKLTIGSGADCTIRLRGPGMHPLHCLILRGRAGMVVRRWSPNTFLNGRTFTDARLEERDVLTVGQVGFEVVADGSIHNLVEPQPVSDNEGGSSILMPVKFERSLGEPKSTASFCDSLRHLRRIGHDRVRRLIKQLRQERLQSSGLPKEIAEWNQDTEQLNAHIQALEANLAKLQADDRRERPDDSQDQQRINQSWAQSRDSELRKAELRLDERAQQLDDATAQLNRERGLFEEQRAAWDEDRRRTEREFAQRNDQLQRQQETLSADARWLETQIEELAQQWEAARQQHAQWEEQHNKYGAELTRESDLRKQHRVEESANIASLKLAVDASSLDEPRPLAGPPAIGTGDQMSIEQATKTFCLVDSPEDPPEEESIDAYMSRLFKRVRGKEAPSSDTFYLERVPFSSPSEAISSQGDETEEQFRHGPSETRTEFAPRHQAPELDSNLAALRELANESARSAIQTSDLRRSHSAAREKLLVTATGIPIGTLLLGLSDSVFSLPALGALCCFGIAAFWAFQAAKIRQRSAHQRVGQAADHSNRFSGKTSTDARDGPSAHSDFWLSAIFRRQFTQSPPRTSKPSCRANVVEVAQMITDPDVIEDAAQTP